MVLVKLVLIIIGLFMTIVLNKPTEVSVLNSESVVGILTTLGAE